MVLMRPVVALVFLACFVSADTAWPAGSGTPAMGMIQVDVGGRTVEGMPLAWGSNVVHVLGRDGRLWSFDPAEATNYRQTASRFQPYSISELRARLLRELGHDYEVSGTTHYLVAHPRGGRDKWAKRAKKQKQIERVPKNLAKEKAEVLYFVGCTASFDVNIKEVAVNTVKLLQACDVDFGMLGVKEKCCGSVLLRVGDPEYERLARENIETFNGLGIKTLVTDIASIEDAVHAYLDGTIVDRTDLLH